MSGHSRDFRASAQAVVVILAFVAFLSPLAAKSAVGDDEALTTQRIFQVAQATLAYSADNDQSLPLAMSFDNNSNDWRYTSLVAVPEGWTSTGARDVPPRLIEERAVCLNAIRSYGADYRVFWAAGVPLSNIGYFVATSRRPQPALYRTGFSYNGQLHAWPVDSVATPTKLVLYIQSYRQNLVGATVPVASLCCSIPGPQCRFNPDGYPQPGQTSCVGNQGYGYVWWQPWNQNFTVWVYDHRIVTATVDGAARSEQYEAPTWPKYDLNVNENPFSTFAPAVGGVPPGSPGWMTDCVKPGGHKAGGVYYAGYFRPDNEFNYTLEQCDFGGG